MSVFVSTLNQTAFLFGFIIIGFILAGRKILPEGSAAVLSKLENTVFIPALVMGTLHSLPFRLLFSFQKPLPKTSISKKYIHMVCPFQTLVSWAMPL